MKQIIDSTQLEFDKSALLIDLVRHENNSIHIEIVQTIYAGNKDDQSIKINPTILDELIQVLLVYQSKMPQQKGFVKDHLSELKKDLIQSYYFKGVPIKDLSMIFSRPEEVIEMILRNRGIAIVSNELPRAKYRRWKKH